MLKLVNSIILLLPVIIASLVIFSLQYTALIRCGPLDHSCTNELPPKKKTNIFPNMRHVAKGDLRRHSFIEKRRLPNGKLDGLSQVLDFDGYYYIYGFHF